MFSGNTDELDFDIINMIEGDDVFNSAFILRLGTFQNFADLTIKKYEGRPDLITKLDLSQPSSYSGLVILLNQSFNIGDKVKYLTTSQLRRLLMVSVNDTL